MTKHSLPETNVAWAYEAGALSWVKRKSSKYTSDSLWWPTILYPSWSFASTQSVLMTLQTNEGSSEQIEEIIIEGCKKKISLNHLRKNMVPQKAALGSARNRSHGGKTSSSKKLPRRVVAHYLGLDSQKSFVANWAAADPSSSSELQKYTIANCKRFYKSYKNKIHPSDWKDFLLAMKEACVAIEDNSYNPKVLFPDKDIDFNEEQEVNPTPEYFTEWTSQSQSQSQSQKMTQFSQGAFIMPKDEAIRETTNKSLLNVTDKSKEIQQEETNILNNNSKKRNRDEIRNENKTILQNTDLVKLDCTGKEQSRVDNNDINSKKISCEHDTSAVISSKNQELQVTANFRSESNKKIRKITPEKPQLNKFSLVASDPLSGTKEEAECNQNNKDTSLTLHKDRKKKVVSFEENAKLIDTEDTPHDYDNSENCDLFTQE